MFDISPASGTASVSNFTSITFKLYDETGSFIAGTSFSYTTTGDAWNLPSDMTYQTLSAGKKWTIRIETKAASGASTGIVVNIQIAVDVQ